MADDGLMTATEPSGMDLTNSSLRTSYSYSQFSPSRVCLNYRHFLINLSKTPAILSLIYQGRIASILRQLPNNTYSRLLFSATDLLCQSFLAKTRLFLTNHPYSRLLFSATDLLCQSFLAKARVFSRKTTHHKQLPSSIPTAVFPSFFWKPVPFRLDSSNSVPSL